MVKFNPYHNKHLTLTIILAILVVILLSFHVKQFLVKNFYKASAEYVGFASDTIRDTGMSATVSWNNVPNPTTTDWIGFFAAGDPDTATPIEKYYTSWTTWSNCSTVPGPTAQTWGTCYFPIPLSLTPGDYEFRLFSNDTKIASDTIIISTPNLTANPIQLDPGEITNVSWQNQADSGYTSWVGFFAQGASNEQLIDWMYVSCTKTPTHDVRNGLCPFTIPPVPAGIYEFRFFDNTYTSYVRQTDTSNPVTVGGNITTSPPLVTPPVPLTTPTPTATPTPILTPTPTVPPQTTGNITGTIYSSKGGIIAGAKISLFVDGKKKNYVSDAQGKYLILNLKPATYLVTYVATGYSDQKSSISVLAGQTVVRNVTLNKKK